MIKFSSEDNKEATLKAFELFGLCMAAGPCNNCVFFDGSLPEDPCSIGCPDSWPLFDTSTKNGMKNRNLVLDVLRRKRMIKLEGRILLSDTVNKNGDIFSKDCKIDIPEKVPLTWDFNHEQVIGFANVTKDDKGLISKAETFSNEHIGIEDLSSIFENGKIGAGGYYTHVKKHNDGSFIVVDEAKLREVALVLAPVNDECYFEIVKGEIE